METEKTKQRYEELKREIQFHNYRYGVLDDPVISDYEFDQLLVELTGDRGGAPRVGHTRFPHSKGGRGASRAVCEGQTSGLYLEPVQCL